MSQPVLIKVYGNIFPAGQALAARLKDCAASAIGETANCDIVELEGDLLKISFEGIYFPAEEFLEEIEKYLASAPMPPVGGKLDILDMEGWELKRYVFSNNRITAKSAPLNNVLDYSGH